MDIARICRRIRNDMDYFESICKSLLERDGYWVYQSFKVNLSPDQKRQISDTKTTIPRPEIDLLALNTIRKEVIAFEAKSFFDSTGVHYAELNSCYKIPEGRYKLFTCPSYQKIVFDQLKTDLIDKKLITEDYFVRLGLIAGNVKKGDSDRIQELFDFMKWKFWSPTLVKEKVLALADEGYENNPVVITAKILSR